MKVKDLPRTAWMGNISAGIVEREFDTREFSDYYATIDDIHLHVKNRSDSLWLEVLERDVKFIYDLPRRAR